MPMSPTVNREEIEKQAALWTARLETGALTASEQRELAAWLEANPDHRWLLSRYRELCAQLRVQLPVLTDAGEVDALIAGVAARQRRWRWAGRTLAVAASFAVAGFVWWMLPQSVGTDFAERRAFTLADGSRVELNAHTSLTIDLGRSVRRVRLERGEAFFTVAHNAARPFIVETAAGSVRVTGTVFDVRAMAATTTEVTVLTGSVQVRPAEATTPTALSGGEQARLAGATVAVRPLSNDAVENAVAWRQGQVAFESAPLSDALERFAAYSGRKITVSPEAAALLVGGRFSLDDPDGFFAAIERAMPVNVLRADGGAVQVVAHPR